MKQYLGDGCYAHFDAWHLATLIRERGSDMVERMSKHPSTAPFEHKSPPPIAPPPTAPTTENDLTRQRDSANQTTNPTPALNPDGTVVSPAPTPMVGPDGAPIRTSDQPVVHTGPGVRHVPGTEIVQGGPSQQ